MTWSPLPRSPLPRTRALHASVALWALAVGAGVAELVLGARAMVLAGAGPAELAPVLLLRGAVFVAATVVIVQLARGRRWTRPALLLGLGVVGLGSMVLPPLAAAVTAADPAAALSEVLAGGPLFAVIRGIHVVAVVAASVLLLTLPRRSRGTVTSAGRRR